MTFAFFQALGKRPSRKILFMIKQIGLERKSAYSRKMYPGQLPRPETFYFILSLETHQFHQFTLDMKRIKKCYSSYWFDFVPKNLQSCY